jgi:N-carbamoyl-L-amino-acid hydrolase
MQGRGDPMLTLAFAVLAANKEARMRGARATVGHISAHPNLANAIASKASASLDARARDDATLTALLKEVTAKTVQRAQRDATAVSIIMEMLHPRVTFDRSLIDRLTAVLPDAPTIDTAAGHTAGIVATAAPAAMLFVRNDAAVPFSTDERSAEWLGRYATDADCAAGVTALADVLTELASG